VVISSFHQPIDTQSASTHILASSTWFGISAGRSLTASTYTRNGWSFPIIVRINPNSMTLLHFIKNRSIEFMYLFCTLPDSKKKNTKAICCLIILKVEVFLVRVYFWKLSSLEFFIAHWLISTVLILILAFLHATKLYILLLFWFYFFTENLYLAVMSALKNI
jgi:hypothetical protein